MVVVPILEPAPVLVSDTQLVVGAEEVVEGGWNVEATNWPGRDLPMKLRIVELEGRWW